MSEEPPTQPTTELAEINAEMVRGPSVTNDNGKVQTDGDRPNTIPELSATTVGKTIEKQVTIEREVQVSWTSSFSDLEVQIAKIRDLAIRIVPADEALDKLVTIRRFIDFKRYRRRFWLLRIFGPRGIHAYRDFEEPLTKRLADIEEKIKSDSKESDLRTTLLELRKLADDVHIKMRQLKSNFIGLVYSLTTSKELVEDLVQQIGPRELREEARVHSSIVAQLVERLESEELSTKATEVLSDEFLGAIGIMIELEQRKSAVEDLVHKDRKRRQWTVAIVIAYIALVLALAVFVGVRWGSRFFIGDGPLSAMRLPLVGIPWPVIVWSLIGSFAAMIYRFNKKPIYDFGDAVKWMLTRPVQGVVLGAAFYLVLISGLFLLGGRGTPENPASNTANDVILILAFLVGFSDRFADSVFNAIVDKYSQSQEPTDEELASSRGRTE
jgi:hypothetical protein